MGYRLSLALVPNPRTADSTATLVAPELDFSLPGDWSLRVGAGRGRNTLGSAQTRISRTGAAPAPLSDDCYCNELTFWETGAEGPLFAYRALVVVQGRQGLYSMPCAAAATAARA